MTKRIENCPVCGTKCTIEGNATMHYEPLLHQEVIRGKIEELEWVNAYEQEAYIDERITSLTAELEGEK